MANYLINGTTVPSIQIYLEIKIGCYSIEDYLRWEQERIEHEALLEARDEELQQFLDDAPLHIPTDHELAFSGYNSTYN